MAERSPIFEISRSNPRETWQQVDYPGDPSSLFLLIAIGRNIGKLTEEEGIVAIQVIKEEEVLRAVVIAEDMHEPLSDQAVRDTLNEGLSLPNEQLPLTYMFLNGETVEDKVGRFSPTALQTVAVLKFVP